MNEDLVERLAEAIHERYLAEQLADGVAMGAHPAMAPWGELPDDRKTANREQARDIGTKLELIGCGVAAIDGGVDEFAFTDPELDLLARHEQRRWVAQRLSAGWSYGPSIDDAQRQHPGIVSYEELSDVERDKDRDAVRNIPLVLATAGLRVVRLHRDR